MGRNLTEPPGDLEVVGMDFSDFLEWFKPRFQPGHHLSIVGPTGEGKTTLIAQILGLRNYVIALDAKGGDSTLAKLEDRGFQRVQWPPKRKTWKDIEEGKPVRLIVGHKVRTTEDLPKLRQELATVLRDVFNQTGWTVYADELQILSDRRLMNLGGSVERILIAARDRGISFLGAFQRPANVPRSMGEMSKWFLVLFTRDRETIERLAEMAGRSAAEMRGLVRGLPPYTVLVFSNRPREPIIVTRAPVLS